ncbi:MAG TPA: CRISPR-associated protein Csx11 [Clostridiales bacterium]|nr:CRISPR-associated protein Csx11 [Clostridiales bacterium]
MGKEIKTYSSDDWIELRNFIFQEIKDWYSHLLSDSRFPINDVTLWDQAYMTASLFKASLAAMSLDSSTKNRYYNSLPNVIKWSILGIQYDKLGLAEKALKPHFLDFYRDVVRKVDDKVKKIIEIDYALGNEIYRDETGIYFIVPENMGVESEENYYLEFNEALKEIKENIIQAFEEIEIETQDKQKKENIKLYESEFYPSIFITKPSRGTMNIAYLLERSRENFLKHVYSKKFFDECTEEVNKTNDESSEPKDYYRLCQVCRFRKGAKQSNYIICDECENKKTKRIENWIDKVNKETIWTGDLQDQNGRIAFVTAKFELKKWLNGNMLNTCVIRNLLDEGKDGKACLDKLTNTLFAIRKIKEQRGEDIEKKQYKKFNITELLSFIREIDEILAQKYGKVSNTIEDVFSIDYKNGQFKVPSRNPSNSVIENLEDIGKNSQFQNFLRTFQFEFFLKFAKDAYNGCKSREETIDDFIAQIFLEPIIGNRWEDFIRNSSLQAKIDFNNKKIDWLNLSDEDIALLAEILFQFIFRKNPSPARLRRIWETTEEFFVELKNELEDAMGIEEWRTRRIVWKNIVQDKQLTEKEYTYKGLDFWVDKKGNVYLISSIEQAIPIIGNIRGKDDMEKIKEKIKGKEFDWIQEFTLKEYDTKNDTNIKLNSQNAKYESYAPYISIIDPTPISWQFIIPAQYLPNVIDRIQEKYKKHFKYIVGKLPLHIGVVVQDYKKPLYIGLKALRKIRRDVSDWKDLKKEMSYVDFKKLQASYFDKHAHETNRPQDYYSLYPISKANDENKYDYEFYIDPSEAKKKLITIDPDTQDKKGGYENIQLEIYANTFDFEFLDANIRRNDIFYDGGKRILEEKKNRPYTWEEWRNFKKFKEFFSDNQKTNKLNQIIGLIYSKIKDWEGNEESLKQFMLSAFVNMFELNHEEKRNTFAQLFDQEMTWNKLQNIPFNDFKQLLWRFVDMYEFWHTALKVL